MIFSGFEKFAKKKPMGFFVFSKSRTLDQKHRLMCWTIPPKVSKLLPYPFFNDLIWWKGKEILRESNPWPFSLSDQFIIPQSAPRVSNFSWYMQREKVLKSLLKCTPIDWMTEERTWKVTKYFKKRTLKSQDYCNYSKHMDLFFLIYRFLFNGEKSGNSRMNAKWLTGIRARATIKSVNPKRIVDLIEVGRRWLIDDANKSSLLKEIVLVEAIADKNESLDSLGCLPQTTEGESWKK